MQPQFNPQKIKLIIGLGNPGREYQNTYHNVGFLCVNFLTKNLPISNFQFLISNTFMNQSGGFVKTILKRHKIKPEELLIVHDDSDIKLGEYKLSFNRGSAGHKGVESVIKVLKTKSFWRLRIGIRPIVPIGLISRMRPIRRPKANLLRRKAGEFVLKKISPRDKKILEETFQRVKEKILFH